MELEDDAIEPEQETSTPFNELIKTAAAPEVVHSYMDGMSYHKIVAQAIMFAILEGIGGGETDAGEIDELQNLFNEISHMHRNAIGNLKRDSNFQSAR